MFWSPESKVNDVIKIKLDQKRLIPTHTVKHLRILLDQPNKGSSQKHCK